MGREGLRGRGVHPQHALKAPHNNLVCVCGCLCVCLLVNKKKDNEDVTESGSGLRSKQLRDDC